MVHRLVVMPNTFVSRSYEVKIKIWVSFFALGLRDGMRLIHIALIWLHYFVSVVVLLLKIQRIVPILLCLLVVVFAQLLVDLLFVGLHVLVDHGDVLSKFRNLKLFRLFRITAFVLISFWLRCCVHSTAFGWKACRKMCDRFRGNSYYSRRILCLVWVVRKLYRSLPFLVERLLIFFLLC